MNQIYNAQGLQAGWAQLCAQHPQDYAISLIANGPTSIAATRKRIKDYCNWLNGAMLGKQWHRHKNTQWVTGLVFIDKSASATDVHGVVKLPSKAKLSKSFADLSAQAWKAVCKKGNQQVHTSYKKLDWGQDCIKCMQRPSFSDNQIIFLHDLY